MILILLIDKIARECLLCLYLLFISSKIINMRNLPKIFIICLLLKINALDSTIDISEIVNFLFVDEGAFGGLLGELSYI